MTLSVKSHGRKTFNINSITAKQHYSNKLFKWTDSNASQPSDLSYSQPVGWERHRSQTHQIICHECPAVYSAHPSHSTLHVNWAVLWFNSYYYYYKYIRQRTGVHVSHALLLNRQRSSKLNGSATFFRKHSSNSSKNMWHFRIVPDTLCRNVRKNWFCVQREAE